MADSSSLKTICVIGAGQMGGGIAQVAAKAGFSVRMSDANLALAEQGKATKLAVMMDTLRPLIPARQAVQLEDLGYHASWGP